MKTVDFVVKKYSFKKKIITIINFWQKAFCLLNSDSLGIKKLMKVFECFFITLIMFMTKVVLGFIFPWDPLIVVFRVVLD